MRWALLLPDQLVVMSCLVYTIIPLFGIFPMASTLSNDCPSSMCGDLEINFPYNLASSSKTCRKAGLNANLSCSSTNDTILTLPSSESYRVTQINYIEFFISIRLSTSSISCPWQKGIQKYPDVNGSIFRFTLKSFVLVNCTAMISWKTMSVGPISCLSAIGSFVYAIYAFERIDIFPPSCSKLYSTETTYDFESMSAQTTRLFAVVDNENIRTCSNCFYEEKNCGYNVGRDNRFCLLQDAHHGSDRLVKGIIIGASLAVFLLQRL